MKLKIIFIIALTGYILFLYIFIEPYWIRINRIEITDPEIPRKFHNFRIVFISDIHHGPYISTNRLQNIVSQINKLQPDIILMGGDYVSGKQYIRPCFRELDRLQAPQGIYGVLGNHDHWESARLTREEMKKAGIINVDNGSRWIYSGKDRIKIGGVGDLWEDRQIITPTIRNTRIKDFVILLSHNPDYADELETDKVDLVLSGHTHGGQITVFGLWAPLLPSERGQKYRSGIIESDITTVIVTTGIGTITPPVRFFARPEIILLKLKQKKPCENTSCPD